MSNAASRRTVLAAAVGVVAGSGAVPAAAAPVAVPAPGPGDVTGAAAGATVEYHGWSTVAQWRCGAADGVRVLAGRRPGIRIGRAAGTVEHTDPHTGTTETWEYAGWTSPEHVCALPATEAVPSWNAHTPPGTWLRVELRARCDDGSTTGWYRMGDWAGGDQDIRRATLDGQQDANTRVWTDTLTVRDPASGRRVVAYRLRLTLFRRPGTGATPTVWRVGAMVSDVPDRFEVAPAPHAVTRELPVPRYSQSIHSGRYPEYNGGGQAWCSPTSTQMIVEYWGRRPAPEELAWVDPAYDDPQVCHAARQTFDHEYGGCGNWAFNTAYAATYPGMHGVVTRLASLREAETLIAAGIPLITSQSFLAEELDGAGYGTAGHLMTLVGFTADGDVIANDPASPSNTAVRRVYPRRQWENIWLRTLRHDANGNVRSGTGGVCYVLWGQEITAGQRRALASVGIR